MPGEDTMISCVPLPSVSPTVSAAPNSSPGLVPGTVKSNCPVPSCTEISPVFWFVPGDPATMNPMSNSAVEAPVLPLMTGPRISACSE